MGGDFETDSSVSMLASLPTPWKVKCVHYEDSTDYLKMLTKVKEW